jgi:hypothetical protein
MYITSFECSLHQYLLVSSADTSFSLTQGNHAIYLLAYITLETLVSGTVVLGLELIRYNISFELDHPTFKINQFSKTTYFLAHLELVLVNYERIIGSGTPDKNIPTFNILIRPFPTRLTGPLASATKPSMNVLKKDDAFGNTSLGYCSLRSLSRKAPIDKAKSSRCRIVSFIRVCFFHLLGPTFLPTLPPFAS